MNDNIRPMETKYGGKSRDNFIIETKDAVYFKSYNTLIAKIVCGKVFLDYKWKYSNTTNYYRCQFLNESGKKTQKKIDSGEYSVINLNN